MTQRSSEKAIIQDGLKGRAQEIAERGIESHKLFRDERLPLAPENYTVGIS
jgi:hypothetical protein